MRSLALLLALLAGCASSSPKDEPSGPCAKRTGTYRFSYHERSGDCGPQSESIVVVNGQPTDPGAGCIGTVGYTSDNCKVTTDATCSAEALGKGLRTRLVGTTTWNHDGTQGGGVSQLSVLDPAGKILCSSTYDIAIVKQ
jgi:hypothetical protein